MAKLFVGNISYDVDDAGLRALFEPHGTVTEAKIVIDKDTGRSKGFAFVSFDSDAAAEDAIEALDGHEIGKRRLKVEISTSTPKRR